MIIDSMIHATMIHSIMLDVYVATIDSNRRSLPSEILD
jgi:hypothetical protein